jgi:hypothetical protein
MGLLDQQPNRSAGLEYKTHISRAGELLVVYLQHEHSELCSCATIDWAPFSSTPFALHYYSHLLVGGSFL